MKRTVDLELEYQPPIVMPPAPPQQLVNMTTSSDQVTMDFWKDIWFRNIKANKERCGSIKDQGIHKLYNCWKWKPCIIIGSGPSLKQYAKYLVAGEENGTKWEGNPGIPVLSALHNFAYLEDLGVKVDHYVSLDAGEVVIDEMFDGGTKSEDHYRELSKNRSLLCYHATNPRLFNNWKGDVHWFNSVLPDDQLKAKYNEVEKYQVYVSSGGNVLGSCFYIAKAIFGCNPLIFMGADFSFSYDKKFHSWDSKYDKQGQTMAVTDIYGQRVLTWPSYNGFKTWFDLKALSVPGVYINCSDGTMGAYPNGNLTAFQYMHIEKALEMYRVSERIKPTMENPDNIEQEMILF